MVLTINNSIKSSSAKHTLKTEAIAIAQQMSQECVARRLRQVTRTVTRLYDEALRSHGLTVNQLNILAVIISKQQIQPGQLGQALGMEKSTISRTVDRMASKGWLKVTPGKDSRTQRLSVTNKGHQLLITVTPIWDALQAGILTTGNNSILDMLTVGKPRNRAEVDNPLTEREPKYASEPVSADDFYM